MRQPRKIPARLRCGLAAALILAVSGCAADGDSGSVSAGGASVAYGAARQAYADALKDMTPVKLVLQSTAPKGAPTGRRFEEYAKAVQDWSGGKITFDIAYANAIAPPGQVDDALADSRIDIGSVIVALEPSKFPASNVLWDLSFVGSQNPVEGLLEWHGAMLQAASSSDAIQQEYEANGMHVLLPAFSSGSYFVNCADGGSELSALKGRAIASQSRVQTRQAKALGMTASTVNYAEMFESLERGVVDCAMSTMTVSSLGGFIPAAPHFAYDPEVGIASPGGSIAIGLERWNALPLAAQQLLYDRLDVLLKANFEATWDNVKAALATIDKEGGDVTKLGDDAVAALRTANDAALDEARQQSALPDANAFVDTMLKAAESWKTQVDGLGIESVGVDYAGFRAWYADGAPDLKPYFDKLYADTLDARRPS